MSFFKKLFGGGKKAEAQAIEQIEHEGFLIELTPQDEGGQYRLCAIISKEIDGEVKTHRLIRADMFTSLDDVKAATIRKAKIVIAEQGDKLLD